MPEPWCTRCLYSGWFTFTDIKLNNVWGIDIFKQYYTCTDYYLLHMIWLTSKSMLENSNKRHAYITKACREHGCKKGKVVTTVYASPLGSTYQLKSPPSHPTALSPRGPSGQPLCKGILSLVQPWDLNELHTWAKPSPKTRWADYMHYKVCTFSDWTTLMVKIESQLTRITIICGSMWHWDTNQGSWPWQG